MIAQDIAIERVFNAPRDLVWKAWTDPQRLMRWWGPKGFTSPACRMDLRVGGKYLFCMRSPEGQDIWSTGVYQEILPQEKLVMTDSFADEDGNVVSAAHYGLDDDFPLELLITVTLTEADGKTRMSLVHSGFPADPTLDMSETGWNESFDKLAASLK